MGVSFFGLWGEVCGVGRGRSEGENEVVLWGKLLRENGLGGV